MRCIKESITHNHNENHRQGMTQEFFTEIHLLSGKLLLIVAMYPLDESRANQLSRVEPSAGAAHPLTRWDPSSHELH
jgi:hypothetical protein